MTEQEINPFPTITANVIHNRKRTDRYELITGEALTQGFGIKWFDAVIPPFGVPPKTAISQAHKNVIRWAKQEGIKRVLVMEDDVKFTHPKALQYFLDNTPDEFDIYLGGACWRKPIPDSGVLKIFCWMHLYIVDERFYDTFLSVRENTDIENALAGLGTYIICQPFAAIQHDTHSDNAKRVRDFSDCLKGKELFDGTNFIAKHKRNP